jgi:hypothetical protein
MGTTQDYFNDWFRDVLRDFCGDPRAGFVVVITSLALLERYLRNNSGLSAQEKLTKPRFWTEFRTLFPQIPDDDTAKAFWHVSRNGLLHQATFNIKTKTGDVPQVGLNDSGPDIECRRTGANFCFMISPTKFSAKILNAIENDFKTFEGSGPPLPRFYRS